MYEIELRGQRLLFNNSR